MTSGHGLTKTLGLTSRGDCVGRGAALASYIQELALCLFSLTVLIREVGVRGHGQEATPLISPMAVLEKRLHPHERCTGMCHCTQGSDSNPIRKPTPATPVGMESGVVHGKGLYGPGLGSVGEARDERGWMVERISIE